MTASEHAAIFRLAAHIVGAMDVRSQWRLPEGVTSGFIGRSYSEKEAATWDAFCSAASVLNTLADAYQSQEVGHPSIVVNP